MQSRILGAYTYYKISDETDGAWGSAREVSIAQALQDEQWDVVTLQQASAVSGVSDSYYETISWSVTPAAPGGGTALASADGGDAVLHSLSAAPAGEEPVQSEGCEPEEPEPEGAEAEGEESTSLPPEGAETAPPASPEVQEAEPSDMPWKKTQQSISCGAATSGDTLTFALNAAAKTDLTYRSSDTAVAQGGRRRHCDPHRQRYGYRDHHRRRKRSVRLRHQKGYRHQPADQLHGAAGGQHPRPVPDPVGGAAPPGG